jgi:hypothetical protein
MALQIEVKDTFKNLTNLVTSLFIRKFAVLKIKNGQSQFT